MTLIESGIPYDGRRKDVSGEDDWKTLSPLVGALLLIMVVAISATGIYVAVQGLQGGEGRDTASRLLFQLRLEEVMPLEASGPGAGCLGVRAVVRNSGSEPAPLEGILLYLYRDDRLAGMLQPVGRVERLILEPGGSMELVFASPRELDEGEYTLRLAGRYSVSDTLEWRAPCGLRASKFLTLSPLNSRHSPALDRVGDTVFMAWTDARGGGGGFDVRVAVNLNGALEGLEGSMVLLIPVSLGRPGEPPRVLGEGLLVNITGLALSLACPGGVHEKGDDPDDDWGEEARHGEHDEEEPDEHDEGKTRAHHSERDRGHHGNEHDDDEHEHEESVCGNPGVVTVASWEGLGSEVFPIAVIVAMLE